MEQILTLDVGTTSVKACLFDRNLRMTASAGREYALLTEGNRAEADPQTYLDAITACVRSLPGRETAAAVCVTTQGETIIPADAAGNPLANAVVWLDSRAEKQAQALSQKLDAEEFYRETGLPALTGALPLCKLMWFREQEPALYEKTDKFLLLEDYLLLWLTGRLASEKSLLTSTGYFSLRTDGYWDKALALAGIGPEKLPPACECGVLLGTVLPARAEALGIPRTAAVVTGAMDQTAAALAAGCTAPGAVAETTGTAMVAAAFTQNPQFAPGHHVTIYRHVRRGAYLYLPISNTAGMALKWFRDAFCPGLPYPELDRLAEEAGPGANGLVFLPYLAGAVDPVSEPDATACFFGARLSSGRGDFIRAVLESTAFQLRDFLAMLESLGCASDSVTSLGGGSSSRLWLQIKADVCRKPVCTLTTAEATSLGAAVLAAQALGFARADAEKIPACRPDPAAAARYDRQYHLYRRLFEAVRPLYGKDEET